MEMPLKKLGDVCHFVRGPFGGSLKKSCFKPNGNAVFEQQHAIYNQFTKIRYFIDDEKFEEMKRFELKSGDLIMSCSGTMGKVAIVPDGIKKGIINQALLKLTPSKDLDVTYLRFWMSSNDFQESLAKYTVGAAIKNVASVKILKQIEVPLPLLSEQKQIVEILDKAFTAIDQAKANIKKNIVNAKELFQSKREDFFTKAYEISGNKSDILQNLCTIKTGKLNANAMVENGKYPFFTCSRQIFSIDNYAFDTEAVLLAGNNASGDFNVKYYKGKFNAYQRTYVLTINNEDLSYSFLKHKLEHNLQAFKRQSVGANTRFLKIGMINNLEIPIPTIKIQNELCNNLDLLNDNLDILISSYVKKLNSLEELKKSSLQKAFSGELTQKEVVV